MYERIKYFSKLFAIPTLLRDALVPPTPASPKDYRFFIEALKRLNDCWVIPK